MFLGSPLFRSTTARAMVIALGASALAFGDTLELLPRTEVDSQGVFLNQILSQANDESFGNILVAPAPVWGQTNVLKQGQIAQLVAKLAPQLAASTWKGAPEIRISRKFKKLEEKELVSLLAEKLQPNRGQDTATDLELSVTQWKPVNVPADPIELRIIEMPPTGLSQFMSTRFEVRCGQELIGAYTAFIQARLFREVWVTRSPLRRGMNLSDADLVRERRDVLKLREPYWTGETADPSLLVTDYVAAGGILSAKAVQTRPVIRRNQPVTAIVKDRFLTVSIQVIALEDGAPDQVIRARNVQSRREVRGKVINEDTIQILF